MSVARKKILFVDDEAFVLQGLQRMLRGMREEWEMEFVSDGATALERLGQNSFDVVVSDMQMPGMSGADLLNEVMARHPRVVRLILSGYSDRATVMRCVNSTHQYLSKPCDADVLKSTVARTTALQEAFNSKELTTLVSRVGALPSLPALYSEMVTCLQSPDASMEDVGGIIEKDIAMTAKVLKVVNSAFFGLARQISSPAEAASYLGADILKSLVLLAHMFQQGKTNSARAQFAETLWTHSLRTATAAKAIARFEDVPEPMVNDAFVAGMLHDVGKLVLEANYPVEYPKVCAAMQTERRSAVVVEREQFGVSHAEVGGYLLALWGLPGPVVQAVALHHTVDASMGAFSPVTAVFGADGLVHPGNSASGLNVERLDEIGFGGRLQGWRQAVDDSLSNVK